MGRARIPPRRHRLGTGALLRDHLRATMQTISPVDGRVYLERATATPAEIDSALQRARVAQSAWRTVPVSERALIMERFCSAFEAHSADLAPELSWQMGRPL